MATVTVTVTATVRVRLRVRARVTVRPAGILSKDLMHTIDPLEENWGERISISALAAY